VTRLQQGRSLIPDLPDLDQDLARKALKIFGLLRLPDVPGKPRLADAAGQWQRDIVMALFGSFNPETMERYIREVFVLVPKKQSKTTGGAAIMVTALIMNQRPRAEFLLVAPTQEVADIAFSQASGMVSPDADPVLGAKFKVQDHIKRITYRQTGASLKVKSFDPRIVTGSKPAGVLLDELHVIAEAKDADRVIGQLRGGLLPNPEAFLITITTQSERPPSGVFKQELHKARRVRDGEVDLPILPVLYEFPRNVDWRDTRTWHLVLPNNGLSITVDRLIPDYNAAVEAGPAELARWASQHLNVEIGMGLKTDRWPGADYWTMRADPTITLDSLIERSEVITIGIDGGGLDDLFGLAVVGRDRESKDWLLWSHGWCHEGVLERRKSIAAVLRDFAAAGELTIQGDRLEDIGAIVEVVQQVKDSGKLAAVGADPEGLGEFVDAMAQIEVTAEAKTLIGIAQGFRMMNAIKTAERRLATGTLRHSGSGLMAWCVSNLKIEPTATAIRATKQNAGDAKIDPAMAMFNAVALMGTNPQPARKPEYQMYFA